MNFQGNDDKERVQGATDLVRLIGEHVQLRPKGRELAGLCPFHDDKNPSMYVSSAKQIYKCFSCGAGGDCFSFVMDYHKMDFREALKYLADRAGIELTPYRPAGGSGGSNDAAAGSGGGESPRKRLLAANEKAMDYFRQQLHSPAGKIAQDYLEKRGISEAMIEAFQVGYAPDSWNALADAVAAKRWDIPAFDKAGLIGQSKSGKGYYDKLRHRLIFPICDPIGRPIAFGGRVLPGTTLDDPTVDAKYLNSPETPIFNKSKTLYGLHLAKKSIIDRKTAVIVEGYTDVIACHQHGAANVVAALGTAFTAQHASELRRFCEKVVLIFDGDEAGQKAADRAVEVLLTGEVDVAIAVLPRGEDPDELLARPDGLAQWNGLIAAAEDALTYLLNRMREAMDDRGTITGKQAVATDFLARLAKHGVGQLPAIRRALILDKLGELLRLSPSQVMEELKRLEPRDRPAYRPQQAPQASEADGQVRESSADQYSDADTAVRYQTEASDMVAPAVSGARLKSITLAERQLIGCLLRRNDLFEHTLRDGTDFCEALPPGELTVEHRRVYQLIHDRLCDAAELTLMGLLAELAERGWDAERRLVTRADVELDQVLGERPDRIEQQFLTAAEAVRSFALERDYDRNRQGLADALAPTTKEDAVQHALRQAQQAARLAEQRRDQPSSGRISRQSG